MAKRSGFDFNLYRSMEVFEAVVEMRQVTRAAALLGITQSAASQHLHSLEEALGTKLIDRATRPIALTRAGISFHRRAQRILNEVEQLKAEVNRLESAPLPILRIGMLASIATIITPTLVEVVRQRFKVPELTLHAGLASDHRELLNNRQADIVITSDAFYDSDGLERHTLLREPFYLVVPRGFEDQAGDLTALSQNLPLVRFAPYSAVGRLVDQHLRRVRIDLARTIDADRASMVIASVANKHGFTLLSPTLLIDGLIEGHDIAVRPLPIAGFSRSITLVARGRELGSIPAVLAEEVRETLRRALTVQLEKFFPDHGMGVVFGEQKEG